MVLIGLLCEARTDDNDGAMVSLNPLSLELVSDPKEGRGC